MSDSLTHLSRSKSAGRFVRQQQKHPEILNQNLEEGSDLNVRVKERGAAMAGEERPRSRLMSSIFKGGGGSDPNSSTGKTSDIKETLKRPLSSLFRRSQSQNERNAATTLSSQSTASALSSLPPQQQQSPPRLAPPGRSPTVATNNSQQNEGRTVDSNGRTATNQQQGARGNEVGNGHSTNSAAVSTTAIRPFSGFPGRRPPLNTQMESTHGQLTDREQQQRTGTATGGTFNTDLSEQAAIAPQISLRRLSGISYTSEHNFARRDGGGLQRRNSGKIGGEIDVNFLSRFLCPADETSDEHIPWNWDSLFVSVSGELREEWALEEEANNGEMTTTGELGAMPNGLK